MGDWCGKVAIVTGGSAGLGKAIAQEFGAAGAELILAARNPERLAATRTQFTDLGMHAATVPTDVTSAESVDELIRETLQIHGRIDVLVNAAGRSTRGSVLETAPEEFRSLYELNFLATVRCVRAAAEHLIASRGHVVNIGSLACKAAARHLGGYPASKAPLVTYAQQLRFELGDHGVHVLLVCPGPIAREDAGQRYDSASSGLPEGARLPGGGVRLRGLSAQRLAAEIRRACETRAYELVRPRKAKLLFALSQIWPSLGDRVIERMSRQ